MPAEVENGNIKEQFLEAMERGDDLPIHDFLDEQNISEVAELINELPEYGSQILNHLSIHRAVSTFKILDFPTQKAVIQ